VPAYLCIVALIHEVVIERTEVLSTDSSPTSFGVVLAVLGGGVVGFHVLRALAVSTTTAGRWLSCRGLPTDPRSLDTVVRHLKRVRWARALSALGLVGVCGAAVALGQVWVSFFSLPFLVSVLVAEALAPEPRRGRVRAARLERRSRSYFGPPRHIAVVRVVLVTAAIGAFVSATQVDRLTRYFVVHGIVVLVGAVAFEAALHRTATRALPDRQPDLMVDTAMRVASARTATAAGLAFGAFGWMLSSTVLLDRVGEPLEPLRIGLGLGAQVVVLLALALSISLLPPLTSWRPQEAS
jgi:hypothetical protein